MKKLIALFLIVTFCVLMFSLTACTKNVFTAESMLPFCNENAFNSAVDNVDTISIDVDIYDVALHSIAGDKVTVDYVSNNQTTVSATLKDNTLHVVQQSKPLTIHISGTLYIVIGIPESWSGYNIVADVDTGALVLEDVKADKINVDCDTGAVNIGVQNASSVHVDVNTGAVKLTGKANLVEVDTDTGAINLDMSVAEVNLFTDTGAINFAVRDNKAVNLESDTGSVRGKIYADKLQYSILVDVGTGSCNVKDQLGTGEQVLKINVDTGTVKITFEN